jgi:hypothetical protein
MGQDTNRFERIIAKVHSANENLVERTSKVSIKRIVPRDLDNLGAEGYYESRLLRAKTGLGKMFTRLAKYCYYLQYHRQKRKRR